MLKMLNLGFYTRSCGRLELVFRIIAVRRDSLSGNRGVCLYARWMEGAEPLPKLHHDSEKNEVLI